MTHQEYLARVETFADSPDDIAEVLTHAGSCGTCRKEERAVEKALARMEPESRSVMEQVARWSAAAAVLVLVVLGFQNRAREPGRPAPPPGSARYLVVGDATGVVAYTPEGIVVGVAPHARSSEKEVTK
jgi:bacterioferritin-associated ferredoxin